MNALLVGGTGGIGRSLLARMKTDPEVTRIMASQRTAGRTSEDEAQVTWFDLDLESQDSIGRAVGEIEQTFSTLDLVIIATGVLHDAQIAPEKRLSQVACDRLTRLYQINAAGPLALLAGLEKPIKRAQSPRIALLSAQVGSIDDNRMGGWYGYRMSKAALNMGVKCLAIEADRWRNDAVVIAVHPGTTLTKLSSPYVQKRKAPVRAPETSARHIYSLIKRSGAGEHGGFFTAEGETLPW